MSPVLLGAGERSGVVGWLREWCPGRMPAAAAAAAERSPLGTGTVTEQCTAGGNATAGSAVLGECNQNLICGRTAMAFQDPCTQLANNSKKHSLESEADWSALPDSACTAASSHQCSCNHNQPWVCCCAQPHLVTPCLPDGLVHVVSCSWTTAAAPCQPAGLRLWSACCCCHWRGSSGPAGAAHCCPQAALLSPSAVPRQAGAGG
jgi:hypothetical protein